MTDPISSTHSAFICYLNGQFLPLDEASLSIRDIGILRAYGVFDYMRTYHGKPFRLMDHVERLRHSAHQIDLHLPKSVEEIAEIVMETISKNPVGEYGVRLLVTGGLSNNNFLPQEESNLAVLLEPLKLNFEERYRVGSKIVTTDLKREFPTVKSTNYIGAIMAVKRANAAGAVDALYVDEEGYVSELTRSNIFFVKDGVVFTADENVLLGITRKTLLQLIPSVYPLEICPITLKEALAADEVFSASSTTEVMPIVQIDADVIGNGVPGPVTKSIHDLFKAYAWESGDW